MIRGRRPAPIRISVPSPLLEERQDGTPTSTLRTPSPRPTTFSPFSSRFAIQTSQFTPRPTTTSLVRSPSPTRTSTPIQLSTSSSTTVQQSPTKTSFITVTQSAQTRAQETVVVTAPPQLVTVPLVSQPTAAPSSGPDAQLGNQPGAETTRGGGNVLPPAAAKFLIAVGVISGVAILVAIAFIVRKRKKQKQAKEEAAAQPEMEADNGGFRAIGDTQPILPR